MKNIRAMIDTNVVLDWIMAREPFAENARIIIDKCMFGNIKGYLAGHTITNIFYILRKDFSVKERKELLLLLCSKFMIVSANKEMIISALTNDGWEDLEDGLQMQCALDASVDYIVTRNIKDFSKVDIKVLIPDDFINELSQ
jgi:predicted nucleic acid-binding protein